VSAIADRVLVIGLGGNVGDEPAIVRRFASARAALAQLGATRSAALYRTAPVGPAQPMFLNTAMQVEYGGEAPDELIAMILELERKLGRERGGESLAGPRQIDLDILIWGSRVLSTPELTVPHPRLVERRFALVPLSDLLGDDLVVPGADQTVRRLLVAVSAQYVERVAVSW
jgi:2-amino-4-hydroxy-6-hydroxymethyldihydropteridine diphosphokinase